MGKHSRRKHRHKNKEDRRDDSAPRNPSAAVNQLRHPDPKIRHAALVALQANFLHEGNKRVNLSVLQAVREQVMDKDVNCASTAAECLAQYVSYAEDDRHQDVMASWTLILIGRLEQCYQAIHSKSGDLKQCYALASPCLRTLCKLIEMNELALNQMNSQKQTFLSTVFGLLQSASTQEATLDDKLNEWVHDTAAFSARCIHSSIDDNYEIAEVVNSNDKIIEMWPSLLASLPDLAQLHVAGCVVTLYHVAPSSWQLPIIINQVLPCLSCFLKVDGSKFQVLEEDYRQAKLLWTSQKEDDELEREVLKSIEKRGEKARDIARRLKQNPREEKSMMEDSEDGRQAMEDSLTAWNNLMMPLQLALEVTANLLSCMIQDESTMNAQSDANSDQKLFQTLVSNNISECIVLMLQNMCMYKKSRIENENGLLKDDLDETISKIAACLANCALSKVLNEVDFPTTWNILRQHATEKGVASVMAALVQQNQGLRELAANDLELIQGMLHSSSDEELHRDAVCLLSVSMSGNPSAAVVGNLTAELIKLMKSPSSALKCEVLNTLMDLYGEDDYHPEVFASLGTLNHFQECIGSISKKDLGPEEEEILFNAERFVDYKQGN